MNSVSSNSVFSSSIIVVDGDGVLFMLFGVFVLAFDLLCDLSSISSLLLSPALAVDSSSTVSSSLEASGMSTSGVVDAGSGFGFFFVFLVVSDFVVFFRVGEGDGGGSLSVYSCRRDRVAELDHVDCVSIDTEIRSHV